MENLKEILYNNAKLNSCEHIIKTYPFLEKTILEAMSQALRIHDVVGRSEQLKCLMDDDKPNCNCELNHCLKKGW